MNKAIVFGRISRAPDSERGVMSLDSQEYAIKEFLATRNIGVFSVLKSVGSAFLKPQSDLKALLNSCKGKLLVVYEANRLSRSLRNFAEIHKICKKNKHDIAIVNRNEIYMHNSSADHQILYDLIKAAQKESEDMGARISRTMRYKKSKETVWGKKRDETGMRIIDNTDELKINRLIKLLSTTGSSVREIRSLIYEVGKTEGKEPFELEEYDINGRTDLTDDRLPYPMSVANIVETFKIYEVRKRRARWTAADVRRIITERDLPRPQITEMELCDDFSNVLNRVTNVPEVRDIISVQRPEFICVWYDPNIGMPPGIQVPDGMRLPSTACEVYIPK